MKIIETDNYNRENVADKLVAENIDNKFFGELMVKALQNNPLRREDKWYSLVSDDYKLCRGGMGIWYE